MRNSIIKTFLFLLFIAHAGNLTRAAAIGFPPSSPNDGGRSKFYAGVCAGMNYYFGDLKNNQLSDIVFYRRLGLQINLEREISNSMRIGAGFFTGSIFGEQHTTLQNLNFKTSLLIPNLGLSYKFTNLVSGKNSNTRFCLWLSAGVEDIFFNPSGDLNNGNGQTYYYWSDGSVRDIPQNAVNSSQAQIITRDYNYETDYRKLNLDNAGKFPRSALGIFTGLAAEYKLSDAWYARIGTIYHFAQTDYLDNITSNSPGSRKGNAGNDRFMFVYAGIFYNLPVAKKVNPGVESCGFLKTETKHLMKHKQKRKGKH
jgi:hypothetical protein